MKEAFPMIALLVLGLGLVFAANPTAAWSTVEFQVIGTGEAGGTCQVGPLTPACVSNSGGQVTGTVIDSGTYTLSLTAGPVGAAQSTTGTCFPANSTGQIVVAATGDLINFKTVGWICEEFLPGSPYHFNGTYRIDSGTGQFAAASGGGSLTATFEKEFQGRTFLKLDGAIGF